MASTRHSIASLPLLRQPSFARGSSITTRRWPITTTAVATSTSRSFASTPGTRTSSPPTASSRLAAKRKPTTPRPLPRTQPPSEPIEQAITSEHHYGVIGGGLTGLTTAHYLARHAKDAHITLYEASGQLGGWVYADKLETEHGTVSMHKGPRMIRSSKSATRYDDLVFYDVLANLDIGDQLKDVGQHASTRYLYYPDHLVRLPGPPLTPSNIIDSIRNFLTEPLWDGTIQAARQYWRWNTSFEPCTQETLDALDEDESVGHFLERVLGLKDDNRPIKNIVSAMLHGIYGGDPYKLSAKHTIFSGMWYQDVGGRLNDMSWIPCKEFGLLADMFDGPNRRKVIELAEKAIGRNMLSFEDGMVTLVDALEKDLAERPNVTIYKNCPVQSLTPNDGKVSLISGSDKSLNETTHDKVISTIAAKQTAQIAKPERSLSVLEETHAVTIQVVNLWYPQEGLLKDNPGFGYLVPSSTPNNDANVLGVIFDSEAQVSKEPGTKLTVMMGGHHWDGNAFFPTDEQGIEIAIETVSKSLGIPRMEGMRASARTCKECLPQHYVGHRELMARAHHQLRDTFKGGLMVAGPSYTNAGIMPSMRAGFEVAMRVAQGKAQPWFGSERHKDDRWWSGVPVWPGTGDTSIKDRIAIDHIGETGLAGFCYREQDTMSLVSPASLLLRKSTLQKNRFTDGEGNWIQTFHTPAHTRKGRQVRKDRS